MWNANISYPFHFNIIDWSNKQSILNVKNKHLESSWNTTESYLHTSIYIF